jgi:hypothetical protein
MILTRDFSKVAGRRRAGGDDRAWLISPQGEGYSCGFLHHSCGFNKKLLKAAQEINPKVDESDVVHILMKEGWARVGYFDDPSIAYLDVHSVTGSIFRKFQEILSSLNMPNNAKVKVGDDMFKWKNFRFFDSMTDAKKFLWHNREGSSRRWANGSDRAWLISPDKEVIACGEDHDEFVAENQDLFRSMGADGLNLEELVKDGWGKIGLVGPLLYLECERLTDFFFKELQEFAKKLEQVKRVMLRKRVIDRQEFLFLDGPADLRWIPPVSSRKRLASRYEGRAWVISPEGEAFDCGEDHMGCVFEGPLDRLWFEEEFEKADSDDRRTIVEEWLNRNGWAKVGYFINNRLAYLSVRTLDNRMFKAFKEILSGWDLDDMAQIEVSAPSRSVFNWKDFRWFDSVLDMRKFARRGFASRKRLASEYEGRAWLISPQGQVINCGNNHERFVLDNRDFFREMGYNIISSDPLVEDGWARIGLLGTFLYIQCKKLTTKYFDILQIIAMRRNPTEVQISVGDKVGDEVGKFSRKEFLEFGSPNEVNRHLLVFRRRSSSLPKSRNFLMGVNLEILPRPLKNAFDLLGISGEKDKLSANQVATRLQANDKLLQDTNGINRTAVELIQDLNGFFQFGPPKKQMT